MRNKKILILCESAIMLSLAFALSYAKVWEMPLGGSITLASMLPIMLISVKYGTRVGVSTAFVYSLLQAFQAYLSGNVFPYCETEATLTLCILFDYIVPFTLIGAAGVFKNSRAIKKQEIGVYVGMVSVVILRFLSHFLTGIVIWGQWAPEGMGKYLYSFLYNGSFLSLDFAICLLAAVLILRVKEMRRLLNLKI